MNIFRIDQFIWTLTEKSESDIFLQFSIHTNYLLRMRYNVCQTVVPKNVPATSFIPSHFMLPVTNMYYNLMI